MSIIELYLLNENNIIVNNIKKLNNYLDNNDNIINNKKNRIYKFLYEKY